MSAPGATVVIVTRDPVLGSRLAAALFRAGITGRLVAPEEATAAVVESEARAVLLDARGDLEGARRSAPALGPAIWIGREREVDQVLAALRAGAREFLDEACSAQEVTDAVEGLLGSTPESTLALEYAGGQETMRRLEVHRVPFRIGRDASNDLVLPHPTVSRFHARIVRQGSRWLLVDNASRHGVQVDNRAVPEIELSEGTCVRLGDAGAPVIISHLDEPGADQPGPATKLISDSEQLSRQEIKDIAGLVDTFLTLNADLVVEDILAIVLARAMEFARAERGVILLSPRARALRHGVEGAPHEGAPAPDPPGGETTPSLEVALARGVDGSPLDAEALQISRRIPSDVLRTGRGIVLEDILAPGQADAHPSTIQLGVRSAMCVPLKARSTSPGAPAPPVLGALYLDSTLQSRPYSSRSLRAMESLASEAAQAIYSSWLYQDSLAKREIDAEMRLASEVQRCLQPPRELRAPWYEVAGSTEATREVGGDFLLYRALDADRLQLILGDVAGKGVPAAMLSAMIDGLCYGVSTRLASEGDIAAVVEQLNAYLVERSALQKFASAVFGVVSSRGVFDYVVAGHPPPFCVRASGAIETLRRSGPVLGLFHGERFTPFSIALSPGDAMVMYSDGVSEARSPSGALFGRGRVQEIARRERGSSAARLHDAILEEVRGLSPEQACRDDVTLLVVRMLACDEPREPRAPEVR